MNNYIDVQKNNFTEEHYTGFNKTPLQGYRDFKVSPFGAALI
jgi:hypothetical protein